MNDNELQLLAANALKTIARNEQIKSYIQASEELYPLLFRAAQRFIAGSTRESALVEALNLISKGYRVSLEYIGENTSTEQECIAAKNEFLQLAHAAGKARLQTAICLDLSHIGMIIDAELAYRHLAELALTAADYGSTVMISAEESHKTDQILGLYKKTSKVCPNVGITLQAHLHRTERDLLDILPYHGRIRLVKGAFQEPKEIALPRSQELNDRYLHLAEMLVSSGRPVSIATHDEKIIEEVCQRGYLAQPNVELEMLYGIRPDRLKKLKDEGYRTKVYVPYGQEWHLYFFHRLAEYPPNIYRAIADMTTPDTFKKSLYFNC
ncbi:proline dehydrogenase family protein [Paenibacillus sp. GCM10027626]|uniref:proline dehydrogenase family protein n=1 Tax=Paenibacillus sp. GCM10027626 TaxID=3273411 RepID=UPI003643570A